MNTALHPRFRRIGLALVACTLASCLVGGAGNAERADGVIEQMPIVHTKPHDLSADGTDLTKAGLATTAYHRVSTAQGAGSAW